jgi:tRNA-dihydrouridine synthase
MSKVPAHWDSIGETVKLRDKLSPATLIVGNGDVESRQQAEELAQQYNLDGIMIGRGVFHDPYVFAKNSPWSTVSKQERIALYKNHVELFAETWQDRERPIHTLNKFCKIYIQGFDGAKELREKLMQAKSTDELLRLLQE